MSSLACFLGLVQDPVVLAQADFVLVAPPVNIGEVLGEDEVARGSLVVSYVHLERGPSAQRRGDIDGRLHARLGEGNGRVSSHGSSDGMLGEDCRERRVADQTRPLVGEVRVCWERNIVSRLKRTDWARPCSGARGGRAGERQGGLTTRQAVAGERLPWGRQHLPCPAPRGGRSYCGEVQAEKARPSYRVGCR